MFIEVTIQYAFGIKSKRILNARYIRSVNPAFGSSPVTIEVGDHTMLDVLEDYETLRTWLGSTVTVCESQIEAQIGANTK